QTNTSSITNPTTSANTQTNVYANTANTANAAGNDLITPVKEWAGYGPAAISDSQMLHSMGYQGSHIPLWVMRNVAKYLVDDEITQDEFTDIIKYLIYNILSITTS
ncbi:MAG: hypothetical protein KGI27_14860, partial [Thaumarchaeota archaeon]|nr:hypothetical protein [Nitrososphaerota archaeon]